MILKDLHRKYYNQILQLAVQNYRNAQKDIDSLFDTDYYEQLSVCIAKLIDKQLGCVLTNHNDKVIGFLAFSNIFLAQHNNIKKAISPIYGYGIKDGYDRPIIISLLFENAAAKLFKQNVGQYEIKVYANDKDVISSYVHNQFGILCTDAIKLIKTPIATSFSDGYSYCELSKKEIMGNKKELIELWRRLVLHLRKSPTFYPGIEFTDEVYWSHINSCSTRVFAAIKTGKIIGIVDISDEGNSFINSDKLTLNAGDLYIDKEYRGKNIAQELLQYVSESLIREGYKRIWVEHGTTNPNAIRFWDKYFSRFTYTLTRQIDVRMFQ